MVFLTKSVEIYINIVSYAPWHSNESMDWKKYATIFSFGKMFFCWNRSICIQWSLREETWLHVCSMPLHTNETREQKTHNICERWNPSFETHVIQKKLLRLNSIKDVMRSFIYCISARIMCLFQELFCCCCCCCCCFWRSKTPLFKTNAMEEDETEAWPH